MGSVAPADTYTWLLTAEHHCPACGSQLAGPPPQCPACGRTLVALVRPPERSNTALCWV